MSVNVTFLCAVKQLALDISGGRIYPHLPRFRIASREPERPGYFQFGCVHAFQGKLNESHIVLLHSGDMCSTHPILLS